MEKRQENLIFDENGLGACRACKRIIGKRDKRYLRIGTVENGEFVANVLLVKRTAFRCAGKNCYARHTFEPFRDEVDLTNGAK